MQLCKPKEHELFCWQYTGEEPSPLGVPAVWMPGWLLPVTAAGDLVAIKSPKGEQALMLTVGDDVQFIEPNGWILGLRAKDKYPEGEKDTGWFHITTMSDEAFRANYDLVPNKPKVI
jgi:hypothetical protein